MEHQQVIKRPLTTEQNKKLKIYCWGAEISPVYNQRTINIIKTDHEKIKEVYAGENHIFVKKENNIYGVGMNYFHQISRENSKHYHVPQIVHFPGGAQV